MTGGLTFTGSIFEMDKDLDVYLTHWVVLDYDLLKLHIVSFLIALDDSCTYFLCKFAILYKIDMVSVLRVLYVDTCVNITKVQD